MSFWKKCSNCKTGLKFGEPYQVCSIASCNHPRSGLQFCTTSCWSAHVPIYRHKDAWAIEKVAPTEAEWARQSAASDESPIATPQRRIIVPSVAGTATASSQQVEKEVLVVVSKLKSYISQSADMNTSADVIEKLSDLLRRACDSAVKNARTAGRKTVMARDFLD